LQKLVAAAATELHRDAKAFTRGNLVHAVRRARGGRSSAEAIERAVTRALSGDSLPGLLPARCRWTARDLAFPGDPPAGVLLVDRRPVLDLFVACRGLTDMRIAVVCLDGHPSSVVGALRRAIRGGLDLPICYAHDAATVVYPFTMEPLASLLFARGAPAMRYADLGLSPLGTRAQRFEDPRLPDDEIVFELEALPPSTLIRYCARQMARLQAS
jgi:hypothetical protein